jgi:hypothetical protein
MHLIRGFGKGALCVPVNPSSGANPRLSGVFVRNMRVTLYPSPNPRVTPRKMINPRKREMSHLLNIQLNWVNLTPV